MFSSSPHKERMSMSRIAPDIIILLTLTKLSLNSLGNHCHFFKSIKSIFRKTGIIRRCWVLPIDSNRLVTFSVSYRLLLIADIYR